jgi:hypothetical protein
MNILLVNLLIEVASRLGGGLRNQVIFDSLTYQPYILALGVPILH